jgi:hypothetical protein
VSSSNHGTLYFIRREGYFFFFFFIIDEQSFQGAVQSCSTVRRTLGSTMASSMGISVKTQVIRAALLVVKETQMSPVAGQQRCPCTISPGHTQSGPRSCLPLTIRGSHKAVTGTPHKFGAQLSDRHRDACTDANRFQSDSTSNRTLERRVDAGNVTVESCVVACQDESFTYAGLEYAQECCTFHDFSFTSDGSVKLIELLRKGAVMR